ncbi:MAG: SDR family NAD(P)-dependent oxidoreductase [Calditrichaeota bacterium]|nr:MAG: SDR family NAD(P)-dependent oxidoreductase [Calditrichota bacterium]
MKVLITGGAGFIGSHLAEKLLENGNEVFVLDDLSTGTIHNIEHLEANPHFHCIIDNIKHEEVTEELIKECDQIYHLAAAVGVKLIVQQPTRTIETNISGTEVILRLASRYRKKVLVTSTSEVYGKSDKSVFSEDDDLVIGPPKKHRWAYAASKAVDEFLAIAYWHEKRLPVVIVRLFNTVGPRQRGQYGMVIPRFISQALDNLPITVYGSGNQTRCFLYVKDCVEALINLMNSTETVGEVFNIGNPREISINDLAQLIKEMTGSSSEIQHIPYEKAYDKGFEDMQRRVPNIDKIHRYIGFTPKVDLPEILDNVIDYFRNNNKFK